jgi:membrane protein YdbS with pleckstrin-like domain
MAPGARNNPVYPSAVDGWIVALIGLSYLMLLGAMVLSLMHADGVGFWTVLGSLILITALITFLGIPCKYILTGDHVLIISGVVKMRIPYQKITGVEKTSNPLSAPAWSLKRVKISTTEFFPGYRLISPKDRDAFISDLKGRLDPGKNSV